MSTRIPAAAAGMARLSGNWWKRGIGSLDSTKLPPEADWGKMAGSPVTHPRRLNCFYLCIYQYFAWCHYKAWLPAHNGSESI